MNQGQANTYTDRELDAKLSGIHEKLDAIFSQTTKTNGRVNRLENWRNYIAGGIAVLSIIGLPIVGVMYFDLKDVSREAADTKSIVDSYKTGFDSLLRKNGIDPSQIIFNDFIR